MIRVTQSEARRLGLLNRNDVAEHRRARKVSIKGRDGNEGRDKAFDALCEAHGLPVPIHELRFHETRRWRFDYVWEGWLALEVQGGIFTNGRHTRGPALLSEHEKLNEAAILGYTVLFCTPADVKSGAVFALVKRALEGGPS